MALTLLPLLQNSLSYLASQRSNRYEIYFDAGYFTQSALQGENLGRQKERLQQLLKEKNVWTTDEVRLLISGEFGVEYTLKQVKIIVKKFGMKYAKPFTLDYRKPHNAEQVLKKHTTY